MSNKNIEVLMKNVVAGDELKEKIRQQTIEKGKVVKFRKNNYKKVLLVACMCVALLGTTTVVVAKNAEKIEKYFAKIFNIDDETVKKLEEEGFYQNMSVSHGPDDIITVTRDGITVEVKETIADKNTLKILVHVRAEEGVKLDSMCYFNDYFVEGIPQNSNWMEYGVLEEQGLNEQWCIVYVDNYKENGMKSGDVVELSFDSIFRSNWETEVLCEMKDGATAIVGGEEYVVKRVGHADEVEMGEEESLDPSHWFWQYHNISYDVEQYAYAFVRVSDGKEYAPDDLVVQHEDNGDAFLLRLLSGDFKGDVISDAEWKFKWKLTANEDYIKLPVNETIEANDLCYYIESVQITPFTFNVFYSERALGTFRYTPLELQVFMKDGSVYKMGDLVPLSIGHDGETYGFLDVMDLDEIEKISIEGKEYFVGKTN